MCVCMHACVPHAYRCIIATESRLFCRGSGIGYLRAKFMLIWKQLWVSNQIMRAAKRAWIDFQWLSNAESALSHLHVLLYCTDGVRMMRKRPAMWHGTTLTSENSRHCSENVLLRKFDCSSKLTIQTSSVLTARGKVSTVTPSFSSRRLSHQEL